jgi:hypothetical protein
MKPNSQESDRLATPALPEKLDDFNYQLFSS